MDEKIVACSCPIYDFFNVTNSLAQGELATFLKNIEVQHRSRAAAFPTDWTSTISSYGSISELDFLSLFQKFVDLVLVGDDPGDTPSSDIRSKSTPIASGGQQQVLR
jgi:hypothetical protein